MSILLKTSEVIKPAIHSLLEHKLRTFLSILGVICGVMAVLAMLSIGEGAKRETLNQIEELGTRNIYLKALSLTEEQGIKAVERLSGGLSSYDAERIISGCSTVQDIAYLKEITASMIGMIKDVTPQIVACSANYAQMQKIFISEGRFITDQDIMCKNMVCVLGDSVAKSLGPNGKIGSHIRIENDIFKVVGVLKRYDRKTSKSTAISIRNNNEMIFIPLGTEKALIQLSLLPLKKRMETMDGLTELIIQIRSKEQVIRTADIIKRIMEISHGGVEDYQMVIPQELLLQSQKTQRTFNIVLGSIAFVSLIVGGIGIMNIMLATVSERTREIGIRRAVGASQEHIIVQFLAESVIMTFSGGIAGIATGILGVWFITTLAGWKTAITFYSIILPIFISILVGIFFGLYPAYQAAKMDPIAALRHE